MSDDLNLMNDMYMASPSYRFRVDLNRKYEKLLGLLKIRVREKTYISCYNAKVIDITASFNKHQNIMYFLDEFLVFIKENWKYIATLSKEELYMILNCVRLARSEGLKKAINISEMEEYQKLEENYTNSR